MKVHIAVLLMVKNEHKRLHITLESIKDFADSLVIYDTGSVDNTIEICERFCKNNNITFRLKQGEFVDFSTSRNVALDFADSFSDINYILLLDTNDELKGGIILRKIAEEYIEKDKSAFLISQEWFSGTTNKYYNVRFIKAHKGWRYKGVVHEYICNEDKIEDKKVDKLQIEKLYIYQDRTKDDGKTSKRFQRDEVLLKKEYLKNTNEPRTLFYLAQTYSCLKDNESAYYYYKLRSKLQEGFFEERYESCFKCGELSEILNLDWYDSFAWYMKAFEIIPRVEPLVKIADYYRRKNNWIIAHTFVKLACELPYPDNCILFIDKIAYEYKRWHLYSIIAFYVGNFEEGEKACNLAIENGTKHNISSVELDKSNLKFYSEKKQSKEKITKNEFIKAKIEELQKENPKISHKDAYQKAKINWKTQK
jgi:hypothetical protein